MVFNFQKRFKKVLEGSKLGLRGSLVYILIIITFGISDALWHQAYSPPDLNPHLPQAIAANPVAAKILWNYNSVQIGGIFPILLLMILYPPKLKYRELIVWFLWMCKLLLIAMLIEQTIVLTVQKILVLKGVIEPIDYVNKKYNLWTSDYFNIHLSCLHTFLFNLFVLIILVLIIVYERLLRKKWKL